MFSVGSVGSPGEDYEISDRPFLVTVTSDGVTNTFNPSNVSIMITDDNCLEDTENFTISISNAAALVSDYPGLTLPDVVELSITDDEGMHWHA